MYWKPVVPPPPLPEDVKRRRERESRRADGARKPRHRHSKALYVLAAIGALTLLVLLGRYVIVPLLVWLGGRT